MATVVHVSGPLFDGRGAHALDVAADRIEKVVADRGADLVHMQLGRVLRHPTGYYQSHITREQRSDFSVVTDRGVIYGPWLEGTGSRNKTTRFKGYATFRKMTQALDAEAAGIAEGVIEDYMGRVR